MEVSDYLRFVFALIFVLALIGLVSWAVRRFNVGERLLSPRRQGRRLRIMETATVDSKRRLVLVRSDDREHLLLIGGASDVVVESGRAARDPAAAAEEIELTEAGE